MSTKPQPITYTTADGAYTVVLKDIEQLVTAQGKRCIRGERVKVNGKFLPVFISLETHPELDAQVEAWKVQWAEYEVAKKAEFDANVPGLDELRKAQDAEYNDRARYHRAFDRMMDDENNDGANPPKPENKSLGERAQELAEQYPRAAVYLRADGYTGSNNSHKYSAGKRAKELIAAGGSIEEAKQILENWLPKESMWN